MTDLKEIYAIPIKQVAVKLGLELAGNAAKCFNKPNHKHNDRNPSLQLNSKSNTWSCHVCNLRFGPTGAKVYGNNLDLVMLYLDYNFNQAIEWFKDKFRINNDIQSYIDLTRLKFNNFDAESNHEIYSDLLQTADGLSKQGLEYLKKRGLSNSTIYDYNIVDIKIGTGKKLMKNYGSNPLSKAGLITKKGKFIFNEGAIIFPFYYFEKIHFLQARNQGGPKYINIALELDYPYNINNLLFDDITNDKCLIAEGVIDTISLAQSGYNVIGIIGASNFKEKWIEYFKIREVTPIIAFDNDAAGENASKKLAELFYKNQIKPQRVSPNRFGDYKDWNEILEKGLEI